MQQLIEIHIPDINQAMSNLIIAYNAINLAMESFYPEEERMQKHMAALNIKKN